MPVQTPQWMDVLCCCICYNAFDGAQHQPVSLVCCHTACRACLLKLKTKQCPFDQCSINIPVGDLPQNSRILKILDICSSEDESKIERLFEKDDGRLYIEAILVLESMCVYLKRAPSDRGGTIWSPQLSRPMQRKLVNLLCCNLVEPDGRSRALKSARSLGERCLTELLLLHQNPHHLSSNLWATVRARGCQFLGPAMQEEVLKLVLLALSEGASISRKVLVMYIVQTLEKEYPQASKTSVGHVVQLLYRASCFNVIKRESESSLMQLKEEFRTYEALRREHDAQIVQIAMEAGLRISPDQWSALLYGDQAHKSHMQSIIDRLQSPQSFNQCIQELLISLQRTGDPGRLVELRVHFETLAEVDTALNENTPSFTYLLKVLRCVKTVVDGQVKFCDNYGCCRSPREITDRTVVAYKFKTSMCRDIGEGKACLRGDQCTFAHSLEEMERYRARSRLIGYRSSNTVNSNNISLSRSVERPMNTGHFMGAFTNEITDLSNTPTAGTQLNEYWNSAPQYGLQATKTVFVPQQGLLSNCTMSPAATAALQPMGPTGAVEHVITTQMAQAMVSPVTSVLPTGPAALMTADCSMPLPHRVASPFGALPFQVPSPVAAAAAVGLASPPIVNAAQPPPTLTPIPTHDAASIAAAGQPTEIGYFWYQPRPDGSTSEMLGFEVPVAHLMPFPQPAMPTYTEFFQAAHSPQTVESYYALPASGLPFVPINAAQQSPSHCQEHGVIIAELTNNQPAILSNNDNALTKEQIQLVLQSKRETNNIGRCTAITQQVHCDGDECRRSSRSMDDFSTEYDLNTQRFVHHIATSLLPDDFGSERQRLKWTSSCGSDMHSARSVSVGGAFSTTETTTTMTSSAMIMTSSSRPPIASSNAVASSSNGFTTISKIPMMTHPKDSLTVTSSMPVSIKKISSMRRSLSSDDDDMKKLLGIVSASSANDAIDADVMLAADSFSSWSLNTVHLPSSLVNNANGGGDDVANSADDSLWRHSSSFADFSRAFEQNGPNAFDDFSPPSSLRSDILMTTNFSADKCLQATIDSKRLQSTTDCKRLSSVNDSSAPPLTTTNHSPYEQRHFLTSLSTSAAGGHQAVRLDDAGQSASVVGGTVDIRRLSSSTLRRELDRLPVNSKRAKCIRYEVESREPESWRSEDDQFVPFSGCPQVSRYGPISRSKTGSVLSAAPLASKSTSAVEVVQVKDVFTEPLTASVVQYSKDQHVVNKENLKTSIPVDSIPINFQAPTSSQVTSGVLIEKTEELRRTERPIIGSRSAANQAIESADSRFFQNSADR